MDIKLANKPLSINATETHPTKGGTIANASLLTINLHAVPVRYLYSGWQSWTLTAWVDLNRPLRPMRPSSMHPMQTDPFYAGETCPHGAWYGAVEFADGQMVFLGSLGLESHVMLDGESLSGWYETGNGEWFIATGEETEFMARYAELLGDRFGKGRAKYPYKVWCSWYSLYTEIHETQLLKILADLGQINSPQSLPFDVFQIDDGWQIGIGDWEPNAKFPSGMEELAARIKETGRKAGLWLAPLLVVPSSSIYREHRDWLLQDENKKLVSAGFNWGEQLYALDTTHPAALDWLRALMKKVRGWGYDYTKLDFLYAGALPGKRHGDMARESAYRTGLKIIREALGEAYLLTCGAPILPSIGLCDGMRIGPDVAASFTSHRDDDLLMNFAAPGVRNALRTTLHRLWLHPLVHTDPDVVYFRSRQNKLSPEQKSLFQDLAQICDFKASSDIPTWMTNAERSALHDYMESSPEVRQIGRTAYRIGNRKVDFGPQIGLPRLPGPFTNFHGSVLGGLANLPALMNAFDKLGKKSLKKMLKHNPV